MFLIEVETERYPLEADIEGCPLAVDTEGHLLEVDTKGSILKRVPFMRFYKRAIPIGNYFREAHYRSC